MAFCGDVLRAKGLVPVGEGSNGCCCIGCCWGANGDNPPEKDCVLKGEELVGGGLCCAKLGDCLAKGFVDERLSEFPPVGSPAPVRLGNMDWRKGFVEVGCCCRGSAIVGSCICGCCCCCEKSGTPFWGIGARLFCGLKGCGV